MASQVSERIQFPVADVLAIVQRTGIAGWFRPGFDVWFRCGIKLYINPAEKEQLDAMIERQAQIAYVAGIVANAQANRPKG